MTSKPDSAAAISRPEWANSRRIGVKVGSALLVDRATVKLRREWLDSLTDDVARHARAVLDRLESL